MVTCTSATSVLVTRKKRGIGVREACVLCLHPHSDLSNKTALLPPPPTFSNQLCIGLTGQCFLSITCSFSKIFFKSVLQQREVTLEWQLHRNRIQAYCQYVRNLPSLSQQEPCGEPRRSQEMLSPASNARWKRRFHPQGATIRLSTHKSMRFSFI